jgi:hypothetical protein
MNSLFEKPSGFLSVNRDISRAIKAGSDRQLQERNDFCYAVHGCLSLESENLTTVDVVGMFFCT